jgi:pantoate--beta-alanine ligase
VKVFNTSESIQNQIIGLKAAGNKIGFVPTMGALHEGHISLLKQAQENCDVVVVSIFVNPTQFNNPDDLIKYPRTLEADLLLLEANHCDLVFTPTVEEIYPTNYKTIQLDLGILGEVMEGKQRPGHFEGVVNVVNRLFDIIKPHQAFFGLKDFQQVTVIKHLQKALQLPIEIIACETLREPSGLALSSRNMRLSDQGKTDALLIYNTLIEAKSLAQTKTPQEIESILSIKFGNSKLELEYFEIIDPLTLLKLNSVWEPGATACIVAHCEGVRLIDNLQLID